MKVIDSVCPGCSLQCGLHIIEDESLELEFMKHCPVNRGKLCTFGVMLPNYYSSPLSKSYYLGNEVSKSEAISAAATALKSSSDGVVVALGDSTNEELIALSILASELDMKMATGMGALLGAIDDEKIAVNTVTLEEIENAASIVIIDVDPYIQYPLLARRLQIALKNGADIIYIGPGCFNLSHMASESYITPKEGIKSKLDGIEFKKESIFIASFGIYSDPTVITDVSDVCNRSEGKMFFLKDYANSEAAVAMDLESYGNTIGTLVQDMENGSVKSLVLVDSPLYESYLDDVRFRSACENLDVFVVIQSINANIVPKNAIMIPIESFYQRRGTLLSTEGVDNILLGDSTGVFDVTNDILELLGKETINFDSISMMASEKIKSIEYKHINAKNITPIQLNAPLHYYVPNPYLVRGLTQGLAKRCNKALFEKVKASSHYVVAAEVVDGVVLAYDKDPLYQLSIEELK